MRLSLILLPWLALLAADKPVPPLEGKNSDQKISIDAVVFLDPAQVNDLLGANPGEGIVVVKISATPLHGETVRINRDDFLLRSDRSGETARPLEPAQIGSSSVMVISSKGGDQGAVRSQEQRIPYGVPGIPGSGGGPPMTIPGNQPPMVGSGTANTSSASATIKDGEGKGQDKKLLDILNQRVLPEGETAQPVSGLLYYLFDSRKQRPKDLELVYRKAPPRVHIRFADPAKKKK